MYHVSPEFFPAGRVLVTRTIPTVYSVPETLGIGPQRVSVNIGLRGLTLNFYSRVIAINIVKSTLPDCSHGQQLTLLVWHQRRYSRD